MFQKKGKNSVPSGITVAVEKGRAIQTDFSFTDSFKIGRGQGCDIQILEDVVSRVHAEVCFRDGKWWITDLDSGNGVWIDGVNIHRAPLKQGVKVELA